MKENIKYFFVLLVSLVILFVIMNYYIDKVRELKSYIEINQKTLEETRKKLKDTIKYNDKVIQQYDELIRDLYIKADDLEKQKIEALLNLSQERRGIDSIIKRVNSYTPSQLDSFFLNRYK